MNTTANRRHRRPLCRSLAQVVKVKSERSSVIQLLGVFNPISNLRRVCQ